MKDSIYEITIKYSTRTLFKLEIIMNLGKFICIALSGGVLTACGGGGESTPVTTVTPTPVATATPVPIAFRMVSGAEACADDCSGNATGSNGNKQGGVAAAGVFIGPLRNVTVEATKPDGTLLGSADLDEQTGMVSIYPGNAYSGPYIFTFKPKASGEFYTVDMKQWHSLSGHVLRVMLPKLEGNFSANNLTETAYQLALTEASVNGNPAKLTTEVMQRNNLHVVAELNKYLEIENHIIDITQLPPLLNAKSDGSTLTTNSASKLSAVQKALLIDVNKDYSFPDNRLRLANKFIEDFKDNGKFDLSIPFDGDEWGDRYSYNYNTYYGTFTDNKIALQLRKSINKIIIEYRHDSCKAVAGTYKGTTYNSLYKVGNDYLPMRDSKISAQVEKNCKVIVDAPSFNVFPLTLSGTPSIFDSGDSYGKISYEYGFNPATAQFNIFSTNAKKEVEISGAMSGTTLKGNIKYFNISGHAEKAEFTAAKVAE